MTEAERVLGGLSFRIGCTHLMIWLYRLQYRTRSSLVHTFISKSNIHWNLLSKMFGLCRSVWAVGSLAVFCLVCTVVSHNNIQVWFISLEEYPFWWTSSLDWLRGFCESWFSRGKHVDLWLFYLIMHSNIDQSVHSHNKHLCIPEFHLVHKMASLKLLR